MATRRRSRLRPKKSKKRVQRAPASRADSYEPDLAALFGSSLARVQAVAPAPAPAHALGNPFAVPMPSNALPAHHARSIVELGRLQHRLWSWCVALALVSLVLVTLFEWVGPEFWGWTLTASREAVLSQLDLLALAVLILEMGAQFKAAKNKMLFLRQNWFLILALLPLGILVRAARIFESLEALQAFQMLGKFGELRLMLPTLNLPLFSPLIAWGEGAAAMVSQWSGLDDLLELFTRLAARLFR